MSAGIQLKILKKYAMKYIQLVYKRAIPKEARVTLRILLRASLCCYLLLSTMDAQGDAIRVGDEMLDGVHVAIKGNEYEILLPETGETLRALTSRKDVKLLATSPTPERERIRAEWEKQRAIRQGVTAKPATEKNAPVPELQADDVQIHKKRLTTSALRQSKAAEQQAEFETQLLLWAQLPQDLRQIMMENVADRAHVTLEVNAAKSESLGEVQQQAGSQLAEESATITARRAEARAAIADKRAEEQAARRDAEDKIAYADRHDDSGYYAAKRDHYANRSGFERFTGRSSFVSDFFATSYEGAYQREVANRDAAIADAASEYQERRQALKAEEKAIKQQISAETRAANARMAELEDEMQRARTDRTVLKMNSDNAIAQAERQLTLMYSLEDALASAYHPSLPFHQVAEMELAPHHGEREQRVRIKGDMWRVLWCINGPAQGSKLFNVSVINAETNQPVGYSTDEVSILRRFLLVEGPGEFIIRVRGAADSAVLVVTDEVPPASR